MTTLNWVVFFYLPKCRNFSIVISRGAVMIPKKYIEKHNLINVWSSSQKANNNFGFKRGYIGECMDGQWLILITDDLWEESSVFIEGSRYKAMNRLRENGYWTRMRKVM